MSPHLPDKGSIQKPSGTEKENNEKFRMRLRQLRAASVGWNFVTAPLVGGALGYGIDWLLQSYPWVAIIGMFLGFISAFIELFRSAK